MQLCHVLGSYAPPFKHVTAATAIAAAVSCKRCKTSITAKVVSGLLWEARRRRFSHTLRLVALSVDDAAITIANSAKG